MLGTYDWALVASAMLVAVLASYVAIEFAGRLREASNWSTWLAAGAISMGSGVWSMHFVGMSAFQLPVAITYSLPLTAATWVSAVAVSALALYLAGRARLTTSNVTLGALAMGVGICVMHYGGMWAMRMEPGIAYDPLWLAISITIAVAASAAALLIVSRLTSVRSWLDIGLRGGAALLMGAAISGMHYSGMQAAQFTADAMCFSGNTLSGAWMTGPVLAAALIGLPIALWFAISDARQVVEAQRARREQDARVQQMAFVDRESGLPNRHRLVRLITDSLAQGQEPLSVVCLRVGSESRSPNGADIAIVAKALREQCDETHVVARTANDQFKIMALGVERPRAWVDDLVLQLGPVLESTNLHIDSGIAVAPQDGSTAQLLMMRAAARTSHVSAMDARDASVVRAI